VFREPVADDAQGGVRHGSLCCRYGNRRVDGIRYKEWYVDNESIASGTIPSLEPADEVTLTYRWRWLDQRHRIKLKVDPAGTVREITKDNNTLVDDTNALSAHFHVEKSFCRAFLEFPTASGSLSCHDWLQQQVDAFNALLDGAVTSLTPRGAGVQVRIDAVTEHEDGTLTGRAVYRNDAMHGLWEEWHDNGQIRARGVFDHGKLIGAFESWHPDGFDRQSHQGFRYVETS